MENSISYTYRLLKVLLVTLLISLYQSCDQRPNSFENQLDSLSTTPTQSQANGEGYPGKLVRYEFHSKEESCSGLNLGDEPSPNDVILARVSENAQLVRKDCEDISPVEVDSSYASDEMNFISYQGKEFVNNNDQASSLQQNVCPGSAVYQAGVQPNNLVTSPLDLFTSSWYIQTGVSVSTVGAANGLPLFSVGRGEFVAEWSRFMEVIPLNAGTSYAFSVYAEPGNQSDLRILFTSVGSNLVIVEADIDLSTGATNILSQAYSQNLEIKTIPLLRGYLTTIFFTPTLTGGVDIGLGPAPFNGPGSETVSLTDLRLFNNVSSYCQ